MLWRLTNRAFSFYVTFYRFEVYSFPLKFPFYATLCEPWCVAPTADGTGNFNEKYYKSYFSKIGCHFVICRTKTADEMKIPSEPESLLDGTMTHAKARGIYTLGEETVIIALLTQYALLMKANGENAEGKGRTSGGAQGRTSERVGTK